MVSEFISAENEIRSFLCEKAKNIKIRIVGQTGSTNDDMKQAARQGEEEYSLLVAESQTKGKGRLGRSFFSPEGTGCYMSLLVRPGCSVESSTLLTTAAATATAQAIERVTGIAAKIKWVNDIFVEGRKVAGILTEGSIAGDKKHLEWAVIGIGINLCEPEGGFPDEIRDIAGALTDKSAEGMRSRLIAEIVSGIIEYCANIEKREYISKYRERLFFLGEEITVIEGGGSYTARAVDIDPMCRLIVRLSDGKERKLHSGEISVRISK